MESPDKITLWKKYVGMALSVAMDFKVLGLIMLNVMLIYMGTWDTVMRPHLEQLQGKDKALAEQKTSLQEKENLQKQYGALEQQLKNLDTELITIPAGNSAKVVSVTESAELMELAKGNLRDQKIIPLLIPPHDQRTEVSLLPTTNSTIDILKPDEVMGAATETPAAPAPAAAPMPGGTPPGGQPGVPVATAPGAPATAVQPIHVGSATLPVERYDYDLKVTGTYPALMDVLNELVIRKKLLRINKVVINRPAIADPQPDAKDAPDFPVKLNMTVSLSLFLDATNVATPAP